MDRCVLEAEYQQTLTNNKDKWRYTNMDYNRGWNPKSEELLNTWTNQFKKHKSSQNSRYQFFFFFKIVLNGTHSVITITTTTNSSTSSGFAQTQWSLPTSVGVSGPTFPNPPRSPLQNSPSLLITQQMLLWSWHPSPLPRDKPHQTRRFMDLSFLHCQNLPSQSQSQTTQPQPPHCSTRFVCICLVSFLIYVVRTIVVCVICLCSNFFYGIVDGFGSKILGEELPLALLAKQVRQIESIRNYIGGLQTNFYFYFFSILMIFWMCDQLDK